MNRTNERLTYIGITTLCAALMYIAGRNGGMNEMRDSIVNDLTKRLYSYEYSQDASQVSNYRKNILQRPHTINGRAMNMDHALGKIDGIEECIGDITGIYINILGDTIKEPRTNSDIIFHKNNGPPTLNLLVSPK
jgi:hypothetical protein